jgi:hypothetical protein
MVHTYWCQENKASDLSQAVVSCTFCVGPVLLSESLLALPLHVQTAYPTQNSRILAVTLERLKLLTAFSP